LIRFLAELTELFEGDVHLTPSNSRNIINQDYIKRNSNIYEIDISDNPEFSYWTEWGGFYDNYVGTQLELYFERFLLKVNSFKELLETNNSLFILPNRLVLINIPKHPWLYSDSSVDIENVIPFLSTSLSSDNPSNNIIRDRNALVRLNTPNFTKRLSENINGIVLNQNMSISFINNDGFFDNEEKWNLLNTPIHLKKAVIENPVYDDFKTIWRGLIENINTEYENIIISASDLLRSMAEPVCDIISNSFNGVIVDNEEALNKSIPIIYGKLNTSLIKINNDNEDNHKYLIAEFITNVLDVFNSDNESISFSFDNNTKIITTTEKASSANVIGYTNNKISDIIKDIITRKTDIVFNDVNWNIDEFTVYEELSYKINIKIESGNVQSAIQEVLKNDMAYLIQHMNGRLTIRRYGVLYKTHNLNSWQVTKTMDKNYNNAQQNYFSSCIINYSDNIGINKSLLFNDFENEAERLSRRRVRKTFDTKLISKEDSHNLAQNLTDRYSTVKQTLKVYTGQDTLNYELLDRVFFNADINERKFSRGEIYFIKEIDPAQDNITLEELDIYVITGEYPETDNHNYLFDNLYADTKNDELLYIVEGV